MAHQSEPVAVLGIGAMGHGMATSALRAGIPTIGLEPQPGRGPGPDRAGSGGRPDRCGRRAVAGDRRHDGDRRRRRRLGCSATRACSLRLRPGASCVQMSTIGVAGIGARRGHRGGGASRRDAARRTRLGKQGPGASWPADHLRVRAGRGQAACLTPLRRAGQAHDLGRRRRDRNSTQARQRTPGWPLWQKRSSPLSRSRRGLGLETRSVLDALDGNPLMSPWQDGQAATDRRRRVLSPIRAVTRPQGRAPRRGGRERPFAALACLADEWQQAVDLGLGHQD